MKHHIAVRSFAGLLATLLLAGCGGGDGGGGTSGPGTPVVTAGSPPSGATGIAYSGYTFTVASGGTAPFTWSETGTLPVDLSLSTSGMLSGTPTAAGTYPVTIKVTDSSMPPLTGILPISLVIDDSPIVVYAAVPPSSGVVTYPYAAFDFSVETGGSPPFSWAVTSGALPAGLMLAANGALSGTPTAAGTFPFTVTATDSAQTPITGSHDFVMVIDAPATLAINTTQTPPNGVHGTPYGFGFAATGGYLPLSWSASAGVPPGLTVGSDGSLTGTPTTMGSFTFTVTVTDSATTPATSSAPFAVVITDPPPPTINNAQLPMGTVGVAYPAFGFTASDGLAPLLWSEMGALPDLTIGPDGILSGTPSTTGHFPITVNVKDALNQTATGLPVTVRVSLVRPAMAFAPTGSMTTARSRHTATRLQDGKVLVTGGADGSGLGLASAELYDPATGGFTATGNMTSARVGHTATLLAIATLPNYGKVLIAGGDQGLTAELYDPITGIFTPTGTMTIAPVTATLLTDPALANYGKVLIVGDSAAELYDPATGVFTLTGSMTTVRTRHTATLLTGATLPNFGKVLITGGGTAAAELYDPANGLFTATGSMSRARDGETATELQDGTVLIAGSSSAEIFDPASQTFAVVGDLPGGGGIGDTATLRSDGTVLVAGGAVSRPLYRLFGRSRILIGHALASLSPTELFAPESEGFIEMGILTRDGHTATLLADGSVLVAGGVYHRVNYATNPTSASATVLSSAELFK